MKKISKILFALFVVFGLGFTLVGCSPKIVSGVVKAGTLENRVLRGEQLDTSSVVAIFRYSDKTTIEVEADDLTFSEVDTSTAGTKDLSISYDNFTFKVKIKVVVTEDEGVTITSMESELVKYFNANRAEKTNKQTEFMDKNQPIYVGDDNEFNFRINASGIDDDGNLVRNLQNVKTNIIVEKKAGDSFSLLDGDTLASYVSINKKENTFKFTEKSIGETFKISVEAINIDPEYDINGTKFSAQVQIMDGFNVYEAKELCVYDNYYKNDYALIKESLGLANVNVKGIVLQDDIKITKEDVATNLFYTKSHPNYSTASGLTNLEVDGTPIDDAGNGVYHRVFANNETFNFVGNYFTIDASEFPKMVVEGTSDLKKGVDTENGSFMTSHFSLFYNTDGSESTDKKSQLYMKNVYFKGNGALNGDVTNSGSIILMKNTRVNTNIYNTVTHFFYIGYFFQKGGNGNPYNGQYVVDSCKGYNSYQCLFYMSGAKHVLIKNSEYKGAGGPAIIGDHVEPNKDDREGGWPTKIDIVNSTIESVVSGQEPWFAAYGAGGVVQALAQLDGFFDGKQLPPTGKTIIAENETIGGQNVLRMNLMVLLKEKGAKISASRIGGYVRIFETEDDYERYYGLNEKDQAQTTFGLDLCTTGELADKAIKSKVTYIQSAKSGGYINEGYGKKGADGKLNVDASIVGTTKAIGIAQALKLENFDNLTLENQKLTLKAVFGKLNEQTLNAVYEGCVTQGAFEVIENWENLTLQQKVEQLNAQIDAFENISYAEGNFLNVYPQTGMGLLMQLYPAK